MLTVNLYAIKDVKAQAFRNPFCSVHTSEAVRAFTTSVKDERTEYGQYPSDFELYHLGRCDLNTGKLVTLETAEFVVGGKSLADWANRVDKPVTPLGDPVRLPKA